MGGGEGERKKGMFCVRYQQAVALGGASWSPEISFVGASHGVMRPMVFGKHVRTPFIMCQNKSTQEAQKQLLYITRGSLDALAEALLPFNGITATDGRTRTSVPRCGSCEFARAVPYESCVKLITCNSETSFHFPLFPHDVDVETNTQRPGSKGPL